MKTKYLLIILILTLMLSGTSASAAELIPEDVPVHPLLQEKFEQFFPPAVIEVTEGVGSHAVCDLCNFLFIR